MTKLSTFTLNDGNKIPVIGVGTYCGEDTAHEVMKQFIINALKVGYRHVDCADFYRNENIVGEALAEALKEGIVSREELFVTTKVWPTWMAKGRPTQSVKRSLKNLQLDYVNLALIHWPMVFKQSDSNYMPSDKNGDVIPDYSVNISDVWKEFNDMKKKGLTKSIGISNFNHTQIKQFLLDKKLAVPAVLQVECHPHLSNETLVAFCKSHGIQMVAYAPLARAGTKQAKNVPSPMENSIVIEIGKKHDKTPAQVILQWQVQRGVAVIPKSIRLERLQENFQICDFQLSEEDMKAINGLNRNWRTGQMMKAINHKNHPFVDEVKNNEKK